jgi:Toprim domain
MPGLTDRRLHYETVMRRRAEEVARMVLPNGRRRGAEFEGTGPDGIKWSINIGNGPKRGKFSIFSIGYHGDPVDFVCRGLFNDNWGPFDKWAAGWSGWNDMRARPELLRTAEEQAQRAERARQERAAQAEAQRTQQAREIYHSADADLTPMFAYLAGRGLPVPAEPVPTLRFGATMRYNLAGQRNKFLPAMVAPIISTSSGCFSAVHRTYIEETADGWRKARVGKPKLSLGPVSGGIIPLINGAISWRDWLTAENAPYEALLLAEGIENALSASIAFPGVRCCAYIYAGNLPAVSELLPRHADPIILAVDRDGESRGRTGILAQREAALERWLDQGRHVIVVAAPRGVKDLNDHLCRLIRKHSYTPQFTQTQSTIDWRTALLDAVPVVAGDPVASWWETVVGTEWDGTARLLQHPALPQIEAPDTTAPAMLVPLHGEHCEPVGVLAAWLARRGDSWGLAPLVLPVRLLGSPDGVVIIRQARRERGNARLVVGLESALVVAAWESETVLCACDLSHAVRCARGVPASIETVDIYGENEDVTTAWQLLLRRTQRALAEFGIDHVRWQRPWKEYSDFAAMYRDGELGLLP